MFDYLTSGWKKVREKDGVITFKSLDNKYQLNYRTFSSSDKKRERIMATIDVIPYDKLGRKIDYAVREIKFSINN